MSDFMELYDLKISLCVKILKILRTLLLLIFFLTNKNLYFQETNAFETGLSDFHKLVVTVMKTYFRKMKPKTIRYRSSKNFD